MSDTSIRVRAKTQQRLHKMKHQLELNSIEDVITILFKMANEHQRIALGSTVVLGSTMAAEEFLDG